MSKDAFQEFLTKLQKDAGLQKELHSRFGDPAAGIPIGELAEFAAGKGYKFTVEEASGRMSDKQLDAVSGGALGFYHKVYPKIEGLGTHEKIFLAPFGKV